MRVARPARNGAGGRGSGREASADNEAVYDAGGVAAGADARAERAGGSDDGGVEALRESGVGESVRVDLEVASDDEREGAGAGAGADGGENGEVVGAQAAPGDAVRE